jgi:hypothetical protein
MQIKVKMYGESGAAHAHAILRHFGFTIKDEQLFVSLNGYDLRQTFVDTYSKNDKKESHKSVSKGWFEVIIPISDDLFAKIKAVKKQNAQKNGNAILEEIGIKLKNDPTPIFRSAQIPSYATPQETNFYNAISVLETELVNFGYRGVQTADVRADYLKTIKFASEEFVELVQSGKISAEEGAKRANLLRNVIFEMSRRKDSELFRAYAQSLKSEAKPFDWFLERYSKKLYKTNFASLATQEQRNAVFLEIAIASGRDNGKVSKLAPLLGRAGKVCLVASLAISVYNIATSEDKVKTAGREGTGILGGIAGGAAGGAAAGLICGPGAPVCSTVGVFVGGAIGAFIATGGYDWLTNQYVN